MQLKKPLKQNIGEQMFMLYNNECTIDSSGNNGICNNNTVKSCGGGSGSGSSNNIIQCAALSLIKCKK